MVIAKVKNSELLKFPYSMSDLSSENNNTQYDNRYSIFEWFNQTDAHIKNGEELVVVEEEPIPSADWSKMNATLNDVPSFKNGKWVFEQILFEKTQEQKDDIANYIPESTTYK